MVKLVKEGISCENSKTSTPKFDEESDDKHSPYNSVKSNDKDNLVKSSFKKFLVNNNSTKDINSGLKDAKDVKGKLNVKVSQVDFDKILKNRKNLLRQPNSSNNLNSNIS